MSDSGRKDSMSDSGNKVVGIGAVDVSHTVTVPLYRLAHGRTGDKGDRSNISIIAYDAALFDLLVQELSCERVAGVFALREPKAVARYLLPRLAAMNFVLDGVLDGGVNDALNLDAHGKALAFLLLDVAVDVPRSLTHLLRPEAASTPATGSPSSSTSSSTSSPAPTNKNPDQGD
jgi:hypothetical protein